MTNIFEIFFFKNLVHKITLKGERKKYLNFLFLNWKIFKFKNLKINIFLILILLKLKPIFNIKKQFGAINKISKARSYLKPKYFPFWINNFKGFKIAVTWFLIPLLLKRYKKYVLKTSLQTCFYSFLNNKRKNLSLICKKNFYLKTLKNKKLFRFKKKLI